jgi:hypothetical protein
LQLKQVYLVLKNFPIAAVDIFGIYLSLVCSPENNDAVLGIMGSRILERGYLSCFSI